MNDQEKLELARKILTERGVRWFSEFLWDNCYALQCGKHLILLEEGAPEQGEPPWVYATGNTDYHEDKLPEEEGIVPLHPDCSDAVFLDFREDDVSEWGLHKDRFVDGDGYEYAVLHHLRRVRDLPAAIIEYAGGIVARPQKQ